MNKEFEQLLDGAQVGSLACVLDDGKPWNTPLHLAFDEQNVYWLSSPDTVHSKVISDRPDVSISIWSDDKSRGLKGIYLHTKAQALNGEAADHGRQIFENKFGNVPESLKTATVYGAPIGDKSTTYSRGTIWYFFADK